jgi:2-methylcitrate dehydratase
MEKIEVCHGGAEYDAKYPDGIPTSIAIDHETLGRLESGLVMYPAGHARNTTANLKHLLDVKFQRLATLGVANPSALRDRLSNLSEKSASEMGTLHQFEILQ